MVVSTEAIRNRNHFIKENIEKRDAEYNQIRILTSLRQHHASELKTIAMPHRVAWGYASQVTFALFGVAIPLVYAKWPDIGGVDADQKALVWFGAGMFTVFAYIFSEVYWALSNRHKSKREIKNKMLAFLGTIRR